MLANLKTSNPEAPPQFRDAAILLRKWHAGMAPGRDMPFYEDVVLGGMGRLADHLVLVSGDKPASFRILRAARRFRDWIGSDVQGALIADLSPECSGTLAGVVAQALDASQPRSCIAHRVRDDIVETYEVLALPLKSRWGPPLIAVHVQETGRRYSLVSTIYRSTDDGMLALAALRDGEGSVIDLKIVALNAAAASFLGRPEHDLLWRRLSDVDGALQVPDVLCRLLTTLQTGGKDQFEITSCIGGREVHLRVGVASIGDLLSATLTDISALKQREASFRLLFDSNPVPMWLYDLVSLAFVGVNDAAVAHYGYDRATFQTMSLTDIWPRDEWDVHLESARSIDHAYFSGRTWRHIKADGSEIEVLTYARKLVIDRTETVLVAIVDVTERKQAEARIAHMAHHDALTGLPNRVLFHERLDEALGRVRRSGENLAVLCLDLDHFKSVNDTLGHPVGDELLRAVSARLRQCCRHNELVARLGGDEFAIIQPLTGTPVEASELAIRLISVVSEPYDVHGHEVVIGASIGIALAPADGEESDGLLRNADMALYRAKADGRGTSHFFEPEMDRRLQARRALELDLRKAFANGDFELFYQPLVTIESNEVSGFEALLRWRHPERGMISPMEFVPLAEEIGLITPLGEWVLRQACVEAERWPGALKIAVNLSPVQFRNRGVVHAVMSALAHSGLAPDRLELEITESVLLGETEANLATLHQLRKIGVRISMDDFGTGYSSLSYLRSFPFDKIKIDRSFVSEMVGRPDCLAIIRAITGLGASLGIATTAEGVETPEQLESLRAEGCTEVQGFLFSPPRPAGELSALMLERPDRTADAA
jgi:diguanylate cyclase (GGDEF)-like protein/PAS domain S-box-containing protein